jgi:Fic family protein
MRRFGAWLGSEAAQPLVMSAVAHLWFVTIHPFEDGNGRMARAVGEHFLAQKDDAPMRYYSFSRAVNSCRKDYYSQLERTQASDLDVTPWILWCLNTVETAMDQSIAEIGPPVNRSRLEKLSATVDLNERQQRRFGRLFEEFPDGVSTAKWAAACGCSQDTAVRDIGGLVASGILKKGPEGSRSTRYLLTVPEDR